MFNISISDASVLNLSNEQWNYRVASKRLINFQLLSSICSFTNYYFPFVTEPDKWNSIVRKVMEIDNSWNNTAGKYIEVYNSVRARCWCWYLKENGCQKSSSQQMLHFCCRWQYFATFFRKKFILATFSSLNSMLLYYTYKLCVYI